MGADRNTRDDGTAATVAGEEVENPDDFRGDPIPGGPTDDSRDAN